jgi:hypothetical protein
LRTASFEHLVCHCHQVTGDGGLGLPGPVVN